MKIINHGLTAKDGIHFTCKYCGCGFLVEDKNDWEIQWLKNIIDMQKHVAYSIKCPECHSEQYVGSNPNKCNHNLTSPYQIMFDREDWEERYEVEK